MDKKSTQPEIKSIDASDLYLSKIEYQQIKSEFCESIRKLVPGMLPEAIELLERISTPNWALEWGLPRWLGEAFDLPEKTIHELIIANIFLLGFVRIIDDVIDDDFQISGSPFAWIRSDYHENQSSPVQHSQATLLGTLLQQLWLRQHLKLLSSVQDKDISIKKLNETYLESAICSLSEWIIATSDQERRPTYGFSNFTEADFLRMGHRFSILKTCCTATCLLAGRENEIHPLTTALEHILVGVVLSDDVFDWVGDLNQGRYNAFIAFCSDLPQTVEFHSKNEQAVYQGIYLGQKTHAFFDLILERLSLAERSAQLASSSKFCQFIECLISDTRSYQATLDTEILEQMLEASKEFMNNHNRGF